MTGTVVSRLLSFTRSANSPTSHVFPFPERHIPVRREAFLQVTSGWPPRMSADTKMEEALPRLPSPLVTAEGALEPGSDPATPPRGGVPSCRSLAGSAGKPKLPWQRRGSSSEWPAERRDWRGRRGPANREEPRCGHGAPHLVGPDWPAGPPPRVLIGRRACVVRRDWRVRVSRPPPARSGGEKRRRAGGGGRTARPGVSTRSPAGGGGGGGGGGFCSCALRDLRLSPTRREVTRLSSRPPAMRALWVLGLGCILLTFGFVRADDDLDVDGTVEEDLGKSREGSRTDDEVVQREEEAIQLDGLNASQIRELREKSEKFAFQAEVNRMMKLIINSLYKNKEIFLRELISNASDALDKIRLISLTDENALSGNEELTVKIKCDKEKNLLHVTDTGVGMTREELVKNLGTIAKSGTSEFLNKMTEAQEDNQSTSELIGQFGVGFYSAFLVADKVIVTSKHNNDTQHIWESDSNEFSVIADPRGNTLGRGTTITLVLKEEASDYLELDTIKNLVKKYSQFINFPIYVWSSKTETVEEPLDEEEAAKEKEESDDEAAVEEEEEEKKPKTKKVEKTVWDWELMNDIKPIWQRPSKEVEEDEYKAFYKSFSKESDDPMAYIHFTAEGEVTFKSILFVPTSAPRGLFDEYGSKKSDFIKLYVRRVFITDDFHDMMPKYLNFVKGVVDSDDLPLNVSRETLQQHKLLKVIRKKLVRKTLDMIKKIADEKYNDTFWKEFGTNIKLGVIEDHSNRTRLAKLLRFQSSHHASDITSLDQYVERMKEKQDKIYFMAGASRKEAESSPFVERLLKKGYEVIYLTEPVDEYCIQALPEFDGKRFQNVAKEGVKFDESEKTKESREAVEKEFEPLLNWMKDKALKDKIEKAVVSQRLTESPCALVASQYGWSGNMERIMKAQAYQTGKDISTNYYASQKKTFEINPRHPLIRDMLRRVKENEDDETVSDLAVVLFETATLRSGYLLPDTKAYGDRIERMLRLSLNIDPNAKVEEEPEEPDDTIEDTEQDEEEDMDEGMDEEEHETTKSTDGKDEL